MDFQSIINEWVGKKVGDGECVIWAAQFACQAYEVCYLPTPVTGGARDIWEQNTIGEYFDKVTGGVPPQGSLVIWGEGLGNYYGHIGVATGEGDANYFTSYDSNWSGKTVQKITHNYNNVLGYLVPKGGSMTPEQLSEIGKRFTSLDTAIKNRDEAREAQINKVERNLAELIKAKCVGGSDGRVQKIIDFFKGL